MNEAWTWHPLGELFEIGAGKSMSAAARNGPDKTPFLRTSNVFWDQIDLSTVDEMAIPEHELSKKLLQPGDLLVCEGGEIGRAAIWNGEVKIMSFQNHLHRLRPIVEEVEPRFYVYFLQSAFTQLGIFEGAGNKTTIPNLSRSRLAGLEVPQPNINEQLAIVAALSRIREAIKTHDQSVALAQDLKRTAMQMLFTRGLRGEVQKETEIGSMPESWELIPVANIATVKGGKRMPKGVSLTDENTGKPYIRVTDFQDHSVAVDQVLFVPKGYEDVIARYVISSDDIYISIAGTIGLVGQVPESLDGANLTENAAKICLTDPNVDARFLMYALSSHACQTQILEATGRNAQPKLALNRIEQIKLPIPKNLNDQREVTSILDAIDRKIDLHQRKRAVLDDLFKALLHKLMTGEIRVGDLNLSIIGSSRSRDCRQE